jgi:hypothetical protein
VGHRFIPGRSPYYAYFLVSSTKYFSFVVWEPFESYDSLGRQL